MQLKEIAETFLNNYQNPGTRKAYASAISPMVQFLGPDRPVQLIQPVDLVQYAQHMSARNLAPATVRKNLKSIKTFFNWLVSLELLEKSPAAAVKVARLKRYVSRDKAMTDEELDHLLDYAKWKPRDYALILFLADTGCRAGGAANLRDEHLDLDTMTATVTEKGGKTRPAWYGERCRDALRVWLVMRIRGDGYVFGHNGEKISPAAISQVVRRDCLGSRLRSLGSHSLRHRKGHQLADQHIAPSIAATALGHESVETTLQHYYPADYETASQVIRDASMREQQAADAKVIKLPKRRAE